MNNDSKELYKGNNLKLEQDKNSYKGLGIVYAVFFLLSLNFLIYRAFDLDIIKNYVRLMSLMLLIVYILINIGEYKFYLKEIRFILVCIVIFMLNGSKIFNLIFISAILIAFKNIDMITTEKILNRINYVLFAIWGISLLIGILENNYYISSVGRLRYTLGFDNPNAAGQFIFSLIMIFIISSKYSEKIKFITGLLFIVYSYSYTDSRTSFIMFFLYYIFYIFFKFLFKKVKDKGINFVINFAVKVGVIIVFYSSFIVGFIMNKFPKLDYITSNRLSIFSNYINSNELRMLITRNNNALDVDNFYLILMYSYGLLIFVYVNFIVLRAIKNLLKEKQEKYISFVLVMLIMGLSESSIIRPELLSVLYFWKIIFHYNFWKKTSVKEENI